MPDNTERFTLNTGDEAPKPDRSPYVGQQPIQDEQANTAAHNPYKSSINQGPDDEGFAQDLIEAVKNIASLSDKDLTQLNMLLEGKDLDSVTTVLLEQLYLSADNLEPQEVMREIQNIPELDLNTKIRQILDILNASQGQEDKETKPQGSQQKEGRSESKSPPGTTTSRRTTFDVLKSRTGRILATAVAVISVSCGGCYAYRAINSPTSTAVTSPNTNPEGTIGPEDQAPTASTFATEPLNHLTRTDFGHNSMIFIENFESGADVKKTEEENARGGTIIIPTGHSINLFELTDILPKEGETTILALQRKGFVNDGNGLSLVISAITQAASDTSGSITITTLEANPNHIHTLLTAGISPENCRSVYIFDDPNDTSGHPIITNKSNQDMLFTLIYTTANNGTQLARIIVNFEPTTNQVK